MTYVLLSADKLNFQAEIVQAILGWDKDSTLLTKVDSSGRTPLHFAALYGRLDVVELFLDDHASLRLASISDNNGSFPVHAAAMVWDRRTVLELITEFPDFYEQVDNQGRNLLHHAVEHGREWLVHQICENDEFAMLLNATDSHGNTPLHLAVKSQYPGIFYSLLATPSVNMGITNKDGLTAGDLAFMARKPERIYYFLDPCAIAENCMYWLRAPRTLDGLLGLNDKPAAQKNSEKDAPEVFNPGAQKGSENDAPETEKQDDMTKTGTIASAAPERQQNYMTTNRSTVSALIATVAFAAAFTVPGGFVTDDHARAGTAILARRFAFKAFVVSDTMAFVCSIVATCFDIYGGAQEIPDSHRRSYKLLASGLVPIGSQSMIAAFAFGFHLVVGSVNRPLIILVYILSLVAVLFCFPGIWAPVHLGMGKALWRRAGWKGLANIHKRPSNQPLLFLLLSSFLFINVRRPLFVLLISATFVVAIILSIALPNY